MAWRCITRAYRIGGRFDSHLHLGGLASKDAFGSRVSPWKSFRFLALMNGVYQGSCAVPNVQ